MLARKTSKLRARMEKVEAKKEQLCPELPDVRETTWPVKDRGGLQTALRERDPCTFHRIMKTLPT